MAVSKIKLLLTANDVVLTMCLTVSRLVLMLLIFLVSGCIDSDVPNNPEGSDKSPLTLDFRENGSKYEIWVSNIGVQPMSFVFEIRPDVEISISTDLSWPITIQAGEELLAYTLDKNEFDQTHANLNPWVSEIRGSLDVSNELAYELPCACSVECKVSQGAGTRSTHSGWSIHAVDFDLPVGTPVHAISDGVVTDFYQGSDQNCAINSPECNSLVNYVEISTPSGAIVEYLHFQQGGVHVELGEAVVAGQEIGLSGNTGFSTAPHLHVAVLGVTEELTHQTVPIMFRTTSGTRILRTGEVVLVPRCAV